jgi:hypothetical protein
MAAVGIPVGAAEETYLWAPGKSRQHIRIDLPVVDQILLESLRGLGATPKRGAEVGGILVGGVDADGVVHITGNHAVYCSHSSGSAYVLTADEQAHFGAVIEADGDERGAKAVGFYRSQVRDGMGLTAEDLRLFDAFLPDENAVILLVKPFATRVSQGAFFFREEGGVRTESSYLEFPFRRRELRQSTEVVANGAGRPVHSPIHSMDPMVVAETISGTGESVSGPNADERTMFPLTGETAPGVPRSSRLSPGPPGGRRWALLPLSFLFLLLGVFLGMQVSVTLGRKLPGMLRTADPLSLGMTVTPSGPTVHLVWDRGSTAVVNAREGVLHIIDGGIPKTVPLSKEQLRTGSVVYPPASNRVEFRLDVRVSDRSTLSEIVEFSR